MARGSGADDRRDGPTGEGPLAADREAEGRLTVLLATKFGPAIAAGLENRRQNMPLTDPVGSYMSMLRDQIGSYRLVERLLGSFLKGKPEDVFYVEVARGT